MLKVMLTIALILCGCIAVFCVTAYVYLHWSSHIDDVSSYDDAEKRLWLGGRKHLANTIVFCGFNIICIIVVATAVFI